MTGLGFLGGGSVMSPSVCMRLSATRQLMSFRAAVVAPPSESLADLSRETCAVHLRGREQVRGSDRFGRRKVASAVAHRSVRLDQAGLFVASAASRPYSYRRIHPRHRTVTPGSPSPLRPR